MAFNTGDPAGAAGRLSEAARELAHTTRGLDRPSDSYTVLGNLAAGTRSMQQSIQQLAQWHCTSAAAPAHRRFPEVAGPGS